MEESHRDRIDDGLGAGATHQVRLFTAKKELLLFQFRPGVAIGRPAGEKATARLQHA